MTDSDLLFSDGEAPPEASAPTAAPWNILIIDDDREVHAATRLVLSDVECLGRPLSFLSLYSAREARQVLPGLQDIAVILLDVVMESDDAGLQLVRYIREELLWLETRIILRTGQPGSAPEREVITQYDINDYKAKAELTEARLFTTVVAALRSYRHLVSLEESRRGLTKIIAAASSLHQSRSMQLFAQGVLLQLTAILGVASSSVLCTHRHAGDNEQMMVLASSGRFTAQPPASALSAEIRERLQAALDSRSSLFAPGHAALYLRTPNQREVVVYIESGRPFSALDLSLLEMFGYNISIGYDNLEMYEQLLEAKASLERRVAERTQALSESEAKLRIFQAAVEYSSASIMITDPEGVIEYVNPALSRITLYDRDALIGQHPSLFRSGRMPPAIFDELWATIKSGRDWRGELLNRRKDGEFYWEDVSISPVSDEAGVITHFVGVKDDISKRKRLEEELLCLATTDPLTGILNRRSFFERAGQALARARQQGGKLSAVMLDIDHFKQVNDTYGHQAGDDVIRSVTRACGTVLRERGIFGRLGGEEFACVLPGTSLEGALLLAERLRQAAVDLVVNIEDAKVATASISLGVACIEETDTRIDDLLRRADAALYAAKRAGRNCVRPSSATR
ncbi:MAG: diguanylate cyclase [Acetobacteraceae bacterium]